MAAEYGDFVIAVEALAALDRGDVAACRQLLEELVNFLGEAPVPPQLVGLSSPIAKPPARRRPGAGGGTS